VRRTRTPTSLVSDISGSVETSWNLRRALIIILFLLSVAIAAVVISAAVKAKTEKCEALSWGLFDYLFRPELYAKKCGCPRSLNFRFSCNSQYLL
jgi:hypothetical protein